MLYPCGVVNTVELVLCLPLWRLCVFRTKANFGATLSDDENVSGCIDSSNKEVRTSPIIVMLVFFRYDAFAIFMDLISKLLSYRYVCTRYSTWYQAIAIMVSFSVGVHACERSNRNEYRYRYRCERCAKSAKLVFSGLNGRI